MKKIKLFVAAISFLLQLSIFAQVQINKPIQMTGTGANTQITGLQYVNNPQDATSAQVVQSGSMIYSTSTGSNDSFKLAINPPVAAYQKGMVFNFISNQNITGAASLQVNNLASVSIKKYINQNPSCGDIQTGQFVTVAYDGTYFQIISLLFPGTQAAGIPLATAASGVDSFSFNANWNASSGATAYYLDVSTNNTFSSFVSGYNNLSVGNVLTWNITGLTPLTNYYYRVRAANTYCGTSANSDTVTVTTHWACGYTLSVVHTAGSVAPVSKTVNYGTVTTSISGAGKCWITQNLGADNQAASATDATDAAAGWYWQFNLPQGYYYNSGNSTVTPSWTMTSVNINSNWASPNDPCTLLLGTGWRIPTESEWTTANTWANYTAAYSSVLKLHAAGYLNNANGALLDRGTDDNFWGSTQIDATDGWRLTIYSGSYYEGACAKAYGMSLRCLKD